MLALCEVQEPITGHKRKTWPRSKLNRRVCTHGSTLFIPGQTLSRLEREFDTRGEEAL